MFEGKTVLVSGAGGGIGREVARHFLAQGGSVIASDLVGHGAAAAAKGLPDVEGRFVAVDADISEEEDVATLIARAAGAWGRLDVVINVAAITGAGLVDDRDVVGMSLDSWDRIIAVNLRGTMLMCREAIPVMAGGGGGAIVNVSSRAAATGSTRLCAYSASKAGVNSLTMHIARTFGEQGIRCNAIMPGVVEGTGAMGLPAMSPEYLASVKRHVPVGRLGTPSDVAHLAAFLASDAQSGYVNGQILTCDGGQSI